MRIETSLLVLDQILHHGHGHAHGDKALVLTATFDLRQKSRFRATTKNGTEVGVFLAPGTVLRGGDVLTGPLGIEVLVESSPESLLEVRAEKPTDLLRAAYHLGNRHVRLQVAAGCLRLQADSVLEGMLQQLGGLQLAHTESAFEPEAGAYGGHAHSHSHGEEDHDHEHPHAHPSGSARIHEFA